MGSGYLGVVASRLTDPSLPQLQLRHHKCVGLLNIIMAFASFWTGDRKWQVLGNEWQVQFTRLRDCVLTRCLQSVVPETLG